MLRESQGSNQEEQIGPNEKAQLEAVEKRDQERSVEMLGSLRNLIESGLQMSEAAMRKVNSELTDDQRIQLQVILEHLLEKPESK